MSLFRNLPLMSVALAVGVLACGDDDDEPASPATSFTATLSGVNEVPPVTTTTATGTAEFTVSDGQIEFTVEVTGIENATQAHIHTGREGQNGPVRLNLCGTDDTSPCTSGTGVLATGTNGTTVGDPPITFDELVEAIRADSAYANVHTDQNPAGEIRGQIVPQ
jgi:hypothetical protein